jgi:sialic acid synthase SpsE
VKDIKKGGVISCNNVKSIRPGYGLSPKYYGDILGKVTNTDVKKGTAFNVSFIQK